MTGTSDHENRRVRASEMPRVIFDILRHENVGESSAGEILSLQVSNHECDNDGTKIMNSVLKMQCGFAAHVVWI